MKPIYFFLWLLLVPAALWAQAECNQVNCKGKCGRFIDTNNDSFCDYSIIINTDTVSEQVENEEVVTVEPKKEAFTYPVFPIVGGLLALYLLTLWFVKKQKMTKPTHRKIWNVALAATCLISCLLGLLLAIFINYNYRPSGYITFLHWHVYVGIAMTIISIFHFLWHWGYYKAIVKKPKK